MILQAEHTFNASTFACRQVAAAGGGMYEAVAAGIGALSGGWHGGANARVMEMVLKMEAQGVMETDVSSWVRKRLNRGERIMGMGHPVYKTRDPRAEILRRLCEQMAGRTGHTQRYRMLLRVQQESEKEFMARGKPGIKANVDFWSGLLYSMLSIPLDLMTPLFATSLVAGWCAHIMEERAGGGQEPYLIPYEPLSEYIGPTCRPVRSEG
jgi:citrate synthase